MYLLTNVYPNLPGQIHSQNCILYVRTGTGFLKVIYCAKEQEQFNYNSNSIKIKISTNAIPYGMVDKGRKRLEERINQSTVLVLENT